MATYTGELSDRAYYSTIWCFGQFSIYPPLLQNVEFEINNNYGKKIREKDRKLWEKLWEIAKRAQVSMIVSCHLVETIDIYCSWVPYRLYSALVSICKLLI